MSVIEDFAQTDLVGNVVDSDVMHGCSVTLKQSMQVSSTVPERGNADIIYTEVLNKPPTYPDFELPPFTQHSAFVCRTF